VLVLVPRVMVIVPVCEPEKDGMLVDGLIRTAEFHVQLITVLLAPLDIVSPLNPHSEAPPPPAPVALIVQLGVVPSHGLGDTVTPVPAVIDGGVPEPVMTHAPDVLVHGLGAIDTPLVAVTDVTDPVMTQLVDEAMHGVGEIVTPLPAVKEGELMVHAPDVLRHGLGETPVPVMEGADPPLPAGVAH
jgi:hypothetical protein